MARKAAKADVVPTRARIQAAPPAPVRRLRSTRSSTAVKNSSDASSDEGGTDSPPQSSRSRRLYPSVVVPSNPFDSASTASVDSVFSARSGIELDTPGTSTAATPFGVDKSITTRRTAVATFATVNKKLDASIGVRGRRQAASKKDQMDADEQMALTLQEQEYGENHSTPASSRRRGRPSTEKSFILGSGDEEASDILEDTESEFDDFPLLGKRKAATTEPAANPRKRARALAQEEETDASPGPVRLSSARARRSMQSTALPDVEDDTGDDDFLDSMSVADSDDLSSVPDDFEAPQDPTSASRSSNYAADATAARAVRTRAIAQRRRRPYSHLLDRAEKERLKLEDAHPKLKSLWQDLETDVPVIVPVQAKQPEGINRSLKSFQLEGVNWMRRMETEGRWKGGLLGDEMGMGKTIQAVSLIMSDYPAPSPSLVVVPPVALMQWSSEIQSYTDGKLKVLVHHNTDPKIKGLKVKDLMKYDVIMISYSGLESIHRKEVKGWKRDDVLVKENSRIHAIKYHRLILDEAHSIKSRTTQVAKACFALKATYKWCLSGTPVQNRIGELFSLLRFLEVDPFASYFCKECDCERLHWLQDENNRCSNPKCKHTGFNHVSLFNQELLNPITSGDNSKRAEAMRKLRLLTDRIMLRRLKRDHTSSMELPPKQIVIHNEFFGDSERDFSKSIMTNTTRTFDTYVARGVMLNNYANIFGLIMQMRQVANHPDLILKKNAEGGQNVLVCGICDEVAEEPIRSMCHHEFCRRCIKDFVRSFEGTGDDAPDCPRCHIALRIDYDQPDIEQADEETVKKSSIINRIRMEDWHSSTKIEMLIYDLYKLRSKKQTNKSIVFSQFTSMLQLVEWRLRRAGFNTVMLDGSMSPAQRQKSIDYFMNNVNVEVFLVSLKAGGVALNLTEASRVFIVDPWWNPAAEWQSADRCHRIGQKRPCVITRLCIEDSVESRMVMLQEKKANLINSTVNKDDVALEKLTPEDMQFLFRGT